MDKAEFWLNRALPLLEQTGVREEVEKVRNDLLKANPHDQTS